jgi:hypothetical protein
MEVFYSAATLDPRDPNTFVALNTQNRMNFPLAYIVTCEANQLRDDGEVMEACLKWRACRSRVTIIWDCRVISGSFRA